MGQGRLWKATVERASGAATIGKASKEASHPGDFRPPRLAEAGAGVTRRPVGGPRVPVTPAFGRAGSRAGTATALPPTRARSARRP